MDQSTDEMTAGRAAAEWWAEQIGSPVFRVISGKEADRESQEFGAVSSMMATLVADRHPIRDGQGEKFVEALTPVVDGKLAGHSYGLSLGVDYGPDRELSEAAEAAGIHPGRFPFKTMMWVKHDHVIASLGYGARARLIWSAPDWVHPPCGQHESDSDGYVRPANRICNIARYHEGACDEWIADPERCIHCGDGYADHYGKNVERRNHSYATRADES